MNEAFTSTHWGVEHATSHTPCRTPIPSHVSFRGSDLKRGFGRSQYQYTVGRHRRIAERRRGDRAGRRLRSPEFWIDGEGMCVRREWEATQQAMCRKRSAPTRNRPSVVLFGSQSTRINQSTAEDRVAFYRLYRTCRTVVCAAH